MPRPRRSRTEQIEDAFADLSIAEQEHMLVDLQKLHRWAKRMQDRTPAAVESQQPLAFKQ